MGRREVGRERVREREKERQGKEVGDRESVMRLMLHHESKPNFNVNSNRTRPLHRSTIENWISFQKWFSVSMLDVIYRLYWHREHSFSAVLSSMAWLTDWLVIIDRIIYFFLMFYLALRCELNERPCTRAYPCATSSMKRNAFGQYMPNIYICCVCVRDCKSTSSSIHHSLSDWAHRTSPKRILCSSVCIDSAWQVIASFASFHTFSTKQIKHLVSFMTLFPTTESHFRWRNRSTS